MMEILDSEDECSPVAAVVAEEKVGTVLHPLGIWVDNNLYRAPNTEVYHTYDVCPGNCKMHPLITPSIAHWNYMVGLGVTLGDLWYDDYLVEEAALSKEEKAERNHRIEEEEEKIRVGSEAFKRANKADRVAVRVGAYNHKAVKKVYQPCKFLYDCKGTPAKPTSKKVVTECWSHEYIDPETKKKVCKHVCDRMHPGEEGWLKEWDGNPAHPHPKFLAAKKEAAAAVAAKRPFTMRNA